MSKIVINDEDLDLIAATEMERMIVNWKNKIIQEKKYPFPVKRNENEIVFFMHKGALTGFVIWIMFVFAKYKITKTEKNYQLITFFTDLLGTHIQIIENLEFYNLALVTKYFLEASAGIIFHKDKIEEYFKDLSYEEYQKLIERKNCKISLKIKENLGSQAQFIYKKVSIFTHPFNGPMYDLSNIQAYSQNLELLFLLHKSYLICTKKIFKILNYEFTLNSNRIFKIFEKYEEEFNSKFME